MINQSIGFRRDTKAKGNIGESLACDFLIKRGFEILEQNYRCKIGEIDIIARSGEELRFIEVKLRKSNCFGMGREAVNGGKQRTIRRVAQYYLVVHNLYEKVFCSFDVIEISGDAQNHEIEFLENCF